MTPETEPLIVAKLCELLYGQIRAGNGGMSVSATLDGERLSLANVSTVPNTLSLNFALMNEKSDDIDLYGSKRIRWLYPRVGTNNNGIDVLKIDVKRTLGVEPLLIGFDGNRRGWTILTMLSDGDGSYIAQEIAFLPVGEPAVSPVNGHEKN